MAILFLAGLAILVIGLVVVGVTMNSQNSGSGGGNYGSSSDRYDKSVEDAQDYLFMERNNRYGDLIEKGYSPDEAYKDSQDYHPW